jgi:hypothetical protein
MNRTNRALVAVVAALMLTGATASAATDTVMSVDTLPNLVPQPPTELEIGDVDEGEGKALRFDSTIANEGEFAFELVGRPESIASAGDSTAEQCIAWAGPRACTERKSIGTLAYHDEHGHYHFEDFALYELRRFKKNGMPDMRKRGLVARSDKVSFCLQDVQAHRDNGPLYAAPWPLYYACLAGQGVQGISPGWLDIYGSGTTGQQIPLNGIPDGTYALVIHTDPGGRVFETNDHDNVAVTGVTLSEEGKKFSIVCKSTPGTLGCR